VTDLALNAIDAVVLGLVVVATWMGFRAGLVATLYSLASWILATAAAIAFAGPVSSVVETFARLPRPVATSVAFVAVIVIVEALFSITGYVAIRPIVALVRRTPMSGADRALGVIPAIARSIFIVAVAILAIEALPVASEFKAAVETSRSGRRRAGHRRPAPDRGPHQSARRVAAPCYEDRRRRDRETRSS